MTENDILTMKAGRELDALVAEKVMGWTQHLYGNWPSQMRPPENIGPPVKVRNVPKYSIDIAAAWDVVERMLDNCSDFELYWEGPGRGFDCHFSGTGVIRGLTAPLAICKAALYVVNENS